MVGVPHTRGHPYKIFPEQCRLLKQKYCFSNRAVTLWNSLPTHVVMGTTVNQFKHEFDEYFTDCKQFFFHDLIWSFTIHLSIDV